MTSPKLLVSIIFVVCSANIALSKDLHRYRRQSTGLCDGMGYADTDKVQCYCKSTVVGSTSFIFNADCMIAQNGISPDDEVWKEFKSINTVERISFASKGDSIVTYVPTLALKSIPDLLLVSIVHGNIAKVHPHAFANLTYLQEIKLSGNGIQTLEENAFSNHANLTSIQLDNNKISEIKRTVFKNLPRLEELFLINNNITTIHDRAFVHLEGLKALELDKNSIFVLTNETFLGLKNLTRLQLSYNNLEIIGDYTFSSLRNLRSLFLDNNNIKILDEKAFQGATKLESLSLAHNKLKELSNPKVFSGLNVLLVLDLKANGLKELSYQTISPIISNFYFIGSSLGFEENEFACDCKLNWFSSLKNYTKNTHLQQKIDNLMCYPSPKLQEEYKRMLENEKSNEEEAGSEKGDYEDYYDEKSMGGKLFFSDIPEEIIPCPDGAHTTPIHFPTIHSTRTPAYTTTRMTETPRIATENRRLTTPHNMFETRTIAGNHNLQHKTTILLNPTEEMVDDSLKTTRNTPENNRIYDSTVNINPTEEMVKDSFENDKKLMSRTEETAEPTAESSSQEMSSADHTKNDGTYSTQAHGSHRGNEIRSRDIIQAGSSHPTITQTLNKGETAPKSLSHVNTSKASSLQSNILSLAIPTCLLLTSVRFKM